MLIFQRQAQACSLSLDSGLSKYAVLWLASVLAEFYTLENIVDIELLDRVFWNVIGSGTRSCARITTCYLYCGSSELLVVGTALG